MANQQAIIYISDQLTKGVSKELIVTNLLATGWDKKDIDEAFFVMENTAKGTNIPTPPHNVPSPAPTQAYSQTVSPTPTINMVQPNSKSTNFWKIFAIILLCIILLPVFFISWGFYLIRNDSDSYESQNDNTPTKEYPVR